MILLLPTGSRTVHFNRGNRNQETLRKAKRIKVSPWRTPRTIAMKCKQPVTFTATGCAPLLKPTDSALLQII